MPKGKNSKKALPPKTNNEMNDWIASLAKQSTASSDGTANQSTVPSKAERIQKRAAKKARRQQRQEERKKPAASTDRVANAKPLPRKRVADHEASKRRLKRLAQFLMEVRKAHPKIERQRLYVPDQEESRIKRNRPLNEINIQPRPSDYSGSGLARKSLYLPFQDPSHIPKLEEEFKEHIPGFFGKQRTKAMKRQLDGDMLWRKLADQKQKGGSVLPKKLAQLPPDERVQAMIDAGML